MIIRSSKASISTKGEAGMGPSADIWAGAILGVVLGSLVIPGVLYLAKRLGRWRHETRPAQKLLAGLDE